MERLIKDLDELRKLAKKLVAAFKGGEVIGLVGELGAGKTTFVQFLAQALGIKETVNSPTFVLMKIYKANGKWPCLPAGRQMANLVHVDAYRINSSDELRNIGLEEYLGRKDTVVVIEWADKVKDILPNNSIIIEFKEGGNENQRIIIFP